jgi:hypothetical protein
LIVLRNDIKITDGIHTIVSCDNHML